MRHLVVSIALMVACDQAHPLADAGTAEVAADSGCCESELDAGNDELDAGAPDAGVLEPGSDSDDAGGMDGGSLDAGLDASVRDSHVCEFGLPRADGGSLCASILPLDFNGRFGTDRVFVSNRHGDWSVLAEVLDTDAGRRRFASGRMSSDASISWIREGVPYAIDSDESGALAGAGGSQSGGVTPAYWPADGGAVVDSFGIGGSGRAIHDGLMLVGGLGNWLVRLDGSVPMRLWPGRGPPENARVIGFLNDGQSVTASSEVVGQNLISFGEIYAGDGGRVGALFNPGYAAGVQPTASAVSGAVVGTGLVNVTFAVPLLWPRADASVVIALEKPNRATLELTNVSTTGDVCGLASGEAVFWIPPTYEAVIPDAGWMEGAACTGALPGGRFLISRVTSTGQHAVFLLRLTE